ncbi:alpha/beta hydrolase [Nocardia sp. 004]|uniref:alpha/beta hydrolase n=1 Tax=Nocardia sp. 004 TaxID=3385978 RepID=UPI0039A39F40
MHAAEELGSIAQALRSGVVVAPKGIPAMFSEHDLQQIDQASRTDRTPAIFVHGLWLLPSSWERWAEVFRAAGFIPVLPGWPDDPDTVAEAKAHPEPLADKTVGQVTEHLETLIGRLPRLPVIIGHSFGGLVAQILAGRGLSAATVAIAPAPFQGVLPLPASTLRAAAPVLSNPANRHRAVPLTSEQFRFSFTNAVDEDEAEQLYQTFAVPAPGAPLFQTAVANLNPWSETKVDSTCPRRGPLLIISGEKDNAVPWAIANAAYQKQLRNEYAITEIIEMPRRGHSLTIDSGWREICDIALRFIQQFAPLPTRESPTGK